MKLKKIFALAGIFLLVGASAYANGSVTNQYGDACKLIAQMGGVFKTLRTLAFVGAAFVLIGWAWTFISAGYDATGTKIDDAKKKAIGFIVGFSLLFGLAMVLQFLPGSLGCAEWSQWGSGTITTTSAAPVATR